jgi:protein-disulfide isomerase/uncharacterized membrane protein
MNEEKVTRGLDWSLLALIPTLLFGVFVGALMTQHHEQQLYGGEKGELIGCEASAEVNCDIVNTSAYSEFLSVPIATWGMGTYLVLLICTILALRGRKEYTGVLLLSGILSSLYSVFLFYISKSELGFVCLWCMRLYAVNIGLLVLSFLAGGWHNIRAVAAWKNTVFLFVVAWGVVIGGQRMYRNSLLGEAASIDLDQKIAQQQEKEEGKPKATSSDEKSIFIDPEGPPPALSFEIQTEDKNTATLTISPDDPWKGSPNASIAIVEFADLECGYCKRTSSEIARVYEAYKDDIIVVFKHYPLDPTCNPGVKNRKHRKACFAALAAICAQEQNKFWAFHDLTFKNQHAITPEDLRLYAQKLELDLIQYDDCLKTGRTKRKLLADTKQGTSLDIHGTPRIWINNKLYRAGSSAQQMALFIEQSKGVATPEAAKKSLALRKTAKKVKPIQQDISPTIMVKYEEVSVEMHTFEAGLQDGMATSGIHVIPATRMSWFSAKEACEKAGMRMCTEKEWLSVCQGALAKDDDGDGEFSDDLVEGTQYPYGDFHNPTRCWSGKDRQKFRPVYTAEMPGCVAEQGVYDLVGNVEEWVGETPEKAVLMGGAYDTPKDKARCYRANDTFGPGYSNKRSGFRCCK